MRITKKAVSLVLAMLMITSLFTIVPMTASAAPPTDTGTGTGGSTTVITPTTAGDDYLTFTAVEAGSSVTLNVSSGSNLQYNLNGAGWESYTAGTQINLDKDDYVRFCGKDTTFNPSNHVSMGGKVACSGNVMSLRLNDGEVQGLSNYCFQYMFSGCTSLTTAPELPATSLASNCYNNMFSGCTSLTTAPVLPATTLAETCYNYMFEGCTSLTTAPALPATLLESYCYNSMFKGCRSLTTAPNLPATTLEDSCYNYMFSGCENLTTAPELPATTLAYNCYSNMFYGCGRLTTAPALPATTLAYGCYNSMFAGCTSLTELPALPAEELVSYCYSYMFYGCSSIKLSETQTAEYSIPYSVPSGGNGTTASSYVLYYALNSMFAGTGGTFKGTPEINKTYYRPAKKYTVTDESVNGTVTASVNGSNVTEAAENADVTLTVAPAEGYQFKSITATCVKNGVEDFSDLVALMGDAVADGCDGVFDGYTFKVEDGKFVIYNSSTLFAELSESDVTDFQVGDEIYAESGYGDEGWYFTLSDNKITDFYWENSTGDYFFTNEFESTGTLLPVALALTTVTEGSQYSFTMPNKPVTVTAEFEEAPAPATYDYTTDGNDGYNFNDTLAVGAGDTLAAANGYSNLFNFKLLGVQKKNDVDVLSTNNNDVRFVSVINTAILMDADEYGYVFAKFDSKEDARAHADEIQAGGSKVLTKPCTETSNTISGDYGLYNNSTDYKYVTATVNGIGTDTVAARFYIRKGSTYYYADYTNELNETYGVCAAAYSDLA